jgi:hypothetical protein
VIWAIFAVLAAAFGLRQWRRHRRNAQGKCAFCATALELQHFRADGARVCGRCATRTKRRAYIALILFATLGILTFAMYLFVIVRDWRQGIPPSLTLVALAIAMPLVFLGIWLWGVGAMRGANRLAALREDMEHQLLAPLDDKLEHLRELKSARDSSASDRQSQN